MEVCCPCETGMNLFFKLLLHFFPNVYIFVLQSRIFVKEALSVYCRNSCVSKFPSACSFTSVLEVDILLLEICCKCEQ